MAARILLGASIVLASAIAVLFVIQVFFGGLGLSPIEVPEVPAG